MSNDLSGKRVLVIGGTGFVGSRLVERLIEANASVRVLVRNFSTAVRITRFPIEMMRGDVTDAEAVAAAVTGCDIVFHCAYGNSGDNREQRLVTVQGTENVLAAALRAKVERVVYLSTLSVYGLWPDDDLDETAPRRYSGGGYADSKLDAEKIAQKYAKERGLPLVILQPTIIYGPFGPFWTVDVLARLKRGPVMLINDGEGLCNVVYIDDVVSALLLAAVQREALGETFLISGEQPITWREFYEGYGRMLKTARTISVSPSEANQLFAQHRRNKRVFKQLETIIREEPPVRSRLLETPEVMLLLRSTRALLPNPLWQALKRRLKGGTGDEDWPQLVEAGQGPATPEVIHPLDVKLNSAKVRVRIDKAKKLLGYQPAYDFERGLRLTEQWAKWANLLDN